MTRAAALALALVTAACGGKRDKQPPAPVATSAPPAQLGPGPATPLPIVATDAVGPGRPATLIAASDAGAWVALCVDNTPTLVVGTGPGAAFDRLLAAGPDDVLIARDGRLVHVDAAARTERILGPVAAAAIDPTTRRLAIARDGAIEVLDPGAAPRAVTSAANPAFLTLRRGRWATLWSGYTSALGKRSCDATSGLGLGAPPSVVDLDPTTTAEAPRLGPELGITPTGEVTLDGEVVIPSACGAEVVAALATPPRVLARCGKGDNLVAGPGGFLRTVGGTTRNNAFAEATILEPLRLDERVVCTYGACVDLVSGESFSTYSNPVLWTDERVVVRRAPDGVWIDHLGDDPATPARHQELALPRIATAITVDTVSGARREGPRPEPAAFIDAADGFLLFGRYLIDLEAGALVATLADDAVAVDRRGRVLVRSDDGALRWRASAQ